jgi:TrmH family RNA methyltransferase
VKTLGKHNPLLKELARLKLPRDRREQGRFLVEGHKNVAELLRSPVAVEMVLTTETAYEVAAGTELYRVDEEALERLSPGETSQGVLAVARLPEDPLARVLRGDSLLVCDEVADPGNVGTLIRTARASGTAGVLLVKGADPYAPKVVRAAAGALFHLPVARVEEWPDLDGFETVGLFPQGGESLYTASLPLRPAWMMGSEAHGLSREAAARTQHAITIPMRSGESLNVAISAALVMFEWVRRQEVSPPR